MWTLEQRQRLSLENQILIGEGFDQFKVYRDATYDSYSASGYATANSGRHRRPQWGWHSRSRYWHTA